MSEIDPMYLPFDPKYLPVTPAQLLEHFAPVAGGGDPNRHLAYYQASTSALAAFTAGKPWPAPEVARATRRGRQMEKDERFWVVAALLALFHSPDRVGALAGMLRCCLGETPPVDGLATWEAALDGELHLFFEVNLPSPVGYRKWLAQHLDERVLVPYLREAADGAGQQLEGATKVDAMLVAADTGFAVLFEAKVLSDASGGIAFDVMRNQIARNIDVMLDANPKLLPPLSERRPERTCLVLLTPEIFRDHPKSRLYGWLMDGYRTDHGLLAEHLPHRDADALESVGGRLGWLTWEDCRRVVPGACGWLPTTVPSSQTDAEFEAKKAELLSRG